MPFPQATSLVLLGLSFALFAVSLGLPAIIGPSVGPSTGPTFRHLGLGCFAGGWAMLIGIVSRPQWFISWLANPLYLATLAVGVLRRSSLSTALIALPVSALACSLCALAIRDFPPNEAQGEVPVTLGPSTYLWIAAMAVSLAAYAVPLLARKPS